MVIILLSSSHLTLFILISILFNHFLFCEHSLFIHLILAIATWVYSGGVGFEPINYDGNVDDDQGSYHIAFVEHILTSRRSH